MKHLLTIITIIISLNCFGQQSKQTAFDAIQKYNKAHKLNPETSPGRLIDSTTAKRMQDSIINAREYINHNDIIAAIRLIKKQLNADDYDEKYRPLVEALSQAIIMSANNRKKVNK